MTDHLSWDAINNLADGRALSAPESAHLADCVGCGAQLASVRALLGAAQQAPVVMEPPVDAWTNIRRAIDDGKAVALPHPVSAAPRVSVSRRTLAAAAVVLIAISSAVTTVVLRGRRDAGTSVASHSVERGLTATLVTDTGAGDISGIEREYLSSASTLRAALDQERPTLAPATVVLVERNLRIIDDAIAEARAALMRDPASTALRALLRKSHEQKIDFLRRTTALLHEA